MTTPNLDELEAKAKAATPGPWLSSVDISVIGESIRAIVDATDTDMMFSCETDVEPHRWHAGEWTTEDSQKRDAKWRLAKQSQAFHDAEHIAANSPDVTLALVARIRALEAGLREACRIADEAESVFGAMATERRMIRTRELLRDLVEENS